jgi:type I restriction enzyme S subunit
MEVDIVEDIKEQEKIASFMRKLDRIIINNNKCNNKIYDLIFDTYNYWFNQFGYNENVELIYNETLKKKIPYDWCTDTVGSIIKETKNGDWGVEEYNEDTVESHCVRGTDLDSLINVFADIPNRLIVKKSFESKKVLYGDLIVEMSGGSSTQSTGRIAYVNDVTLKRYDNLLISSNFCKVISLKNQNYYAWFFCMWNNLYQSGVFFNYEGKTSGIKNLLYDDFVNNVFILIPSKEIVDKFNSIAIPLLNKVQKNINDNKYLINLKLEMFDSLINGQLKIVD